MKYLARTTRGYPLLGDEEGFVPLKATNPNLNSIREALPKAADGKLNDPGNSTYPRISPANISFGTPLKQFGKLWGIGLNYTDHANDLDEERPDEPASFLKPSSTLTGPGGPIQLPPIDQSERVTAEAELAVVIGRECHSVDQESTDDVIAGFIPVIDITAEDILQKNPRYLTRAKSYDTFLVIGRAIAVPDNQQYFHDKNIKTEINGVVEAQNEIGNMLFPPREIVSFHSDIMTLQIGDLFSTGTPGAAVIRPGDEVRATIESIGSVDAAVTR